MGIEIRPATAGDVEVLHRFILELAEEQGHPDAVRGGPDELCEAMFGDHPVAEAVLAEVDGEPVGFALFHPSFSTWVGRPGVHLEDLYVRPDQQGAGVGRALLGHLAALAVERGGRLTWWVLRDNAPAIGFYRRLGASELTDIAVLGLDGDALHAVAAGRP